jgi:hypothetical protein
MRERGIEGSENYQEKPEYFEKTCPGALLSTTDSMLTITF